MKPTPSSWRHWGETVSTYYSFTYDILSTFSQNLIKIADIPVIISQHASKWCSESGTASIIHKKTHILEKKSKLTSKITFTSVKVNEMYWYYTSNVFQEWTKHILRGELLVSLTTAYKDETWPSIFFSFSLYMANVGWWIQQGGDIHVRKIISFIVIS